MSVTLFKQPPKPLARPMTYYSTPAPLLFDLRSPQDSTSFYPVAQEQACNITIAVRDLAARRLIRDVPGARSRD